MEVAFYREVFWDGDTLYAWANHSGERICCKVGREAILALPGHTYATAQEIGSAKHLIAELLQPHFATKILRGEFDPGPRPTVNVSRRDLRPKRKR
jgi:hypothetical protein